MQIRAAFEEQMSDAVTVLEDRIASIADALCLSSCALLAPPPRVEGNEKSSFYTSSPGMARCDRVCQTDDAMHETAGDADGSVAAKEVTVVSNGGMSYEDSTGCQGDELPGKTEDILVADMLRKRMLVLSCRVLSWWSEVASSASQLKFAEMIQVAACLHTKAFALKFMRSQICSPADFWLTTGQTQQICSSATIYVMLAGLSFDHEASARTLEERGEGRGQGIPRQCLCASDSTVKAQSLWRRRCCAAGVQQPR